MTELAVLFEAPERLSLRPVTLEAMRPDDVTVEVRWSAISTGTERLLWTGQMPPFPGLAYPLVPGYEAVGRVVDAGCDARDRIGDWVFVPGARCYRDAQGLFGASARRLVVPAVRALSVPESLGSDGVLFALAATALHMLTGGPAPDLIVGHGVLGRLLERMALACGTPAPTVWETDPLRQDAGGIDPQADPRRDYAAVYDVSGAAGLLPDLIARLRRGGEVVLGGFYKEPLSFPFAPAFQREARIRVAAEWQPADLIATRALIESGRLDLSGLVTDVRPATQAEEAYATAFGDPCCLKMTIDWRNAA